MCLQYLLYKKGKIQANIFFFQNPKDLFINAAKTQNSIVKTHK